MKVDTLIFYYKLVNKSFFTLLSIPMKWINLLTKKLQIISTRNCLQNMILKCLCPRVECCTTMVHLVGVPIKKSCSPSLTPGILSFCPESLLKYQIEGNFL